MDTATHHSAAVKAGATGPAFPPLETVTKPNLTTAEYAYYTNLQPQTCRVHACMETGPVRPLRIFGRLHWPTADTKRVLGVAA